MHKGCSSSAVVKDGRECCLSTVACRWQYCNNLIIVLQDCGVCAMQANTSSSSRQDGGPRLLPLQPPLPHYPQSQADSMTTQHQILPPQLEAKRCDLSCDDSHYHHPMTAPFANIMSSPRHYLHPPPAMQAVDGSFGYIWKPGFGTIPIAPPSPNSKARHNQASSCFMQGPVNDHPVISYSAAQLHSTAPSQPVVTAAAAKLNELPGREVKMLSTNGSIVDLFTYVEHGEKMHNRPSFAETRAADKHWRKGPHRDSYLPCFCTYIQAVTQQPWLMRDAHAHKTLCVAKHLSLGLPCKSQALLVNITAAL